LPNAPIPNIKRRQKPDYLAEVKNWDSGDSEQIPPQISPLRDADNETPASWNPAAATCMVLGVICYAFGLVDFAGMPFHYDITGVSWSPIVAGLIGSAMVGAGYKLNKGREPISNSAITISLMLVGLVTAGSIYYFSSGGRLFTPISSLESQVKSDIQTKLAQDPATSSIQIKSFSLVHESGNKYKGIFEAQTDGNKESAEVEVTYDGRTFMWKILPQTITPDSSADKSATADQVFDPKTGQTKYVNPETGLPIAPATKLAADMPPLDYGALDPATGLPLEPRIVSLMTNDTHTAAQDKAILDFAFEGVKIGDTLSSMKQKFPKMESLSGQWEINSSELKTADDAMCFFQSNRLVEIDIAFDYKTHPKWKSIYQELVSKYGKEDDKNGLFKNVLGVFH
jgi:hypothetical protein